VTLADTIVANSPSGGNCAYAGGTDVDGGYNLDSGATCGLSGSDDENNVNPALGPPQGNGGPTATMALSATSPAVDAIPAGINGCGTTLATDQRGALRPSESGCDIGAYEYGDIALQALAVSADPVPKGTDPTYTTTVSNAGATAGRDGHRQLAGGGEVQVGQGQRGKLFDVLLHGDVRPRPGGGGGDGHSRHCRQGHRRQGPVAQRHCERERDNGGHHPGQ
jgi:hypothetical protein